MSNLNTRFKRCTQVSGAVGGSVLMAGSSGVCCESAVGIFGLRVGRGLEAPGTIAQRRGEFGAKTPW